MSNPFNLSESLVLLARVPISYIYWAHGFDFDNLSSLAQKLLKMGPKLLFLIDWAAWPRKWYQIVVHSNLCGKTHPSKPPSS